MIGINIKKSINNRKGITLVESLVSVTLFAVIIISASQVFRINIEVERDALAAQSVQESLKYFMEVISKEIRTAQKDSGVCSNVSDDNVYTTNINTNELYFKNDDGECVKYSLSLSDDIYRFEIERDALSDYATPHNVSITNLKFIVDDDLSTIQPLVTIKFDAQVTGKGVHTQPMKFETTVSSRYYE